jgi:hypothetical protein
MNSIVWTYPGFQTLPKGVKQMLVASEAHFFNETKQAWSSAVLGKLKSGTASKPRGAGLVGGQTPKTGGKWAKPDWGHSPAPVMTANAGRQRAF